MHPVAVFLDHLAPGRARASDVATPRMEVLELACILDSWEKAHHLEPVPQKGATLVNKEEESHAIKETELHQRLCRSHQGQGSPPVPVGKATTERGKESVGARGKTAKARGWRMEDTRVSPLDPCCVLSVGASHSAGRFSRFLATTNSLHDSDAEFPDIRTSVLARTFFGGLAHPSPSPQLFVAPHGVSSGEVCSWTR